MKVSKTSLQDALLSAVPEAYRPTVYAILEVERAYALPTPDIVFEVELNVKRHGSERFSSFLAMTNGLVVEETQVNERFARALVDLGVATKKGKS